MIDLNDPRNEHILAHPHFLSGIEHGVAQERKRIMSLFTNRLVRESETDELMLVEYVKEILHLVYETDIDRVNRQGMIDIIEGIK